MIRPAAILCLQLITFSPIAAATTLSLQLGDIGDGIWRADGVMLQLELDDKGDHYQITADHIQHPALPGPIRAFHFDCQQGRIETQRIRCREGLATLHFQDQTQRNLKTRFDWNIETQVLELAVDNIAVFGGTVVLHLQLAGRKWQLETTADGIQLERLGAVHPALSTPLRDNSAAAILDFDLQLRGEADSVSAINGVIKFDKFGFADNAGRYIGQGLKGEWYLNVFHDTAEWSGDHRFRLTDGETLTPYFYLAATEWPMELQTHLSYRLEPALLQFNHFKLTHRQLSVEGQANASLGDAPRLSRLELTLPPVDIKTLYEAYLMPVVSHRLLSDLELAGQVGLQLNYAVDSSALSASLHDVYIEQGLREAGVKGRGRFALYRLNGDLHWSSEAAPESHIQWLGGHLLGGLELGASRLNLNLSDNRVELTQATDIPLLDGTLRAEKFALTLDQAGPRASFEGYLTPISMQAVSTALDWPPLSGQVSGMIPGIRYEEGLLSVDGIALIKLFGGAILVNNLQLDELLGALPTLTADLELKNIDLETLTRAFSFGKITGKLAGRVDDLRLEGWKPVAFDARFATPEDDSSSHRISQKAVDNISNLGGAGISGAISRSFLRFFDEFRYDRLGISCRLEQGVCHMGGVEQAERGYYLVKGGGIPQIDILGFNRRVDWDVLVDKLTQITAGGPPIIE